ncbi:HlyD family efflux transporter periplasmic adaptor subunit [Cetobacterium sp. 2A]|uniref:HlyD family secretion protein n=1 Tax=Cetobacterium sp. 2A TaxID=2754723 RepID=UPI00163C3A4D|nr:HlyD family efflux transporter periplasmic adaptor subunit [Cetobacterium sp. 2A]MBC2857098.1 HlyD family efflux transporter periplasmic adaptor subunit [Cetobacterium sp. 2A]
MVSIENLKKFGKKYIIFFILLMLAVYFTADYIISNRERKLYFGTLEMDKVNISPEILGKISYIAVEQGDTVKKGQHLVDIDNEKNKLILENNKISLKTSENQLLKTLDGTREEEISAQREIVKQLNAQVEQRKKDILTATSNLEFASSNFENKQKIYKDTKSLFEKKFESQYSLDTARINYENTLNQLQVAKHNLENSKIAFEGYEAQKKSAEENLRLMINGFSKRDIEVDKLKIQSSEKNLELTQLNINKNVILAPLDGVVESVNFKLGEVVGTGNSIITMLDSKNLWTKIYVHEKILPKLHLGQKVVIRSNFVPKNYEGEIIYIASNSEFTPMNIVTKEDRLKLVYQIKVKVLNNDDKLKSGMLAEVNFGL